ncbi:hypothetical protein SAMN04488244_105191 [Vibrio hangzhouensis]|uniref:DUF3299 domain-containing protein n=2 Tax=Vibrio hangzhouensis TaxID=462991 RepID=A0A1H5WAG8_9VIBR|nr:hypothetical protein SAMN04488244_105191 [Vibrio hangzhouensis]
MNWWIALLLPILSVLAHASEPVTIQWKDLQPETANIETNLPDITERQRESLQMILLLDSVPSAENQAKSEELISELSAQGIDARFLLEQRRQFMEQMKNRAEQTTEAFNHRSIRMAGFIVPLDMDGLKTTEFLLVPVAGACIHLPPPPANQIIRVHYPKGFEIKNVQYPVWIEGVIQNDKKTEDVFLVDGNTAITMGYKLDAVNIQDYYQAESL